MKLILYITILLLLITLSCNCKVYAQSNSFTTDELRLIAKALNEHDFLAEQDSLNTLLLNQYASAIMDFKTKELLYQAKEHNYQTLIDETKPAWYNNFFYGSTVTAFVFSLIVYAFN